MICKRSVFGVKNKVSIPEESYFIAIKETRFSFRFDFFFVFNAKFQKIFNKQDIWRNGYRSVVKVQSSGG